ncbi:MAG: hypothetical protein AAGG01_15440, partial [Planctomycetota bacterium]
MDLPVPLDCAVSGAREALCRGWARVYSESSEGTRPFGVVTDASRDLLSSLDLGARPKEGSNLLDDVGAQAVLSRVALLEGAQHAVREILSYLGRLQRNGKRGNGERLRPSVTDFLGR